MLRIFRKKKVLKRGLFILAVLIIPPFLFWGMSNIRNDAGKTVAGEVFGKKIRLDKFRDYIEETKNMNILRSNDPLFARLNPTIDVIGPPGFDQVWNRILLIKDAKKKDISSDDQEVVNLIKNLVIFKENNKFNQEKYKQLLNYSLHISPEKFEQQIRDTILMNKMYSAVTKPVKITDEELWKIYELRNEKISLEYIEFKPENYTNQVKIIEEELKEFYGQNGNQFMKPASIKMAYVFIPPLKEDDDLYNKKMRLNRIIDNLKKGVGLEVLVKKYDLKREETVFFFPNNPVPGIGWSKEISQAAFDLEEGQTYPDILENQKGYWAIKITKKRPPYIPQLNEVKSEVDKAFLNHKAKEKAKEEAKQALANVLKKTSGNTNVNLNKTARGMQLVAKTTEPFGRYDVYIPELGQSKHFSSVAFNLEEGQVGPLVTTDNGAYIIKLDKIYSADSEKFQEEKETFKQNILEQFKKVYFRKYLEGLRKVELKSYIQP